MQSTERAKPKEIQDLSESENGKWAKQSTRANKKNISEQSWRQQVQLKRENYIWAVRN